MAEKQYELPDNPNGIQASGGRLNLTNLSDSPMPGNVGYANVSARPDVVGEFTKPVLATMLHMDAKQKALDAKAAEDTTKAKTLKTFARTLLDFNRAPENQELNPFEKQYKLNELTLQYIGSNMQYADELGGIMSLAKQANEQADGRFIKVEKEGAFVIDAHGEAKFYGTNPETMVQMQIAKAHAEIAPERVASIAYKFKDDQQGYHKAIEDEIYRKSAYLQSEEDAKLMDNKLKLVNADDTLRFRTYTERTLPAVRQDIIGDLTGAISDLKDQAKAGVTEDQALAAFERIYNHTIDRPDTMQMFAKMNKMDEYTKFKAEFNNYLELAKQTFKAYDVKNRTEYDKTVVDARLAIDNAKFKLGLPVEYRYGIENGQGLYNFGLMLQLTQKMPGMVPGKINDLINIVRSGDPQQTKAETFRKGAAAGDKKSFESLLGYTMNGLTNALQGYTNTDLPRLGVDTLFSYIKSIETSPMYGKVDAKVRVQLLAQKNQFLSLLTPAQVKELEQRYQDVKPLTPAPGN